MLLKALREHRALLLLVALHAVLAAIVLETRGIPRSISLGVYRPVVFWLLIGYGAAFLFGYFWWIVLFVQPAQLRRHLRDELVGRYFEPSRLLDGVIAVAAISIALSVYTSVKSVMPQIVPFSWDRAFMQADLWLHGGRHPWQWLQPLLGTPSATAVISVTYHLWFVVMYIGLFWQAFSRRDPLLRQQYLLSFVLVWALLGNVAATLLSSAGPCYFGVVAGDPDPYQPLMQYLRSVNDGGHPLSALTIQAELWHRYLAGGVGIGSGISAMPSIHNAMIWLLVFACWRTHRGVASALAAYAALIFVGSVHLGWHYAVDTYVAVALTYGIWALVGRWLRRAPAPVLSSAQHQERG